MRRGPLLTLFLIVFIDLMGFGLVLPNLQLYGKEFGVRNDFVLVLLGPAYSLFQFLLAPVLGRWSDRVGRRPVLIISQAGALFGFLLLFAAHWFETGAPMVGLTLIFLSRIISGMAGGNISTAAAYIADVTEPEDRAKGMGLLGAAFGLGFVFGPALGGITAKHAGLYVVPLLASAFSLTALVMTITTLPESLIPGRVPEGLRRFSFGGIRRALRRPVVGGLIWMFFVNGFAFAGMEQTLSLLIYHRILGGQGVASWHGLANPPEEASGAAGYLLGFLGVIMVIIQGALIHRLTRWAGAVRLVIAGPVFTAAGLAVLGLDSPTYYPHLWPWTGFVVGCALLAVGASIFTPSLQALISQHAGAEEQGAVLGANQGMASLARTVGPLLAGVLFAYVSLAAPYLFGAALCLAVGLWAWALRGPMDVPRVGVVTPDRAPVNKGV